MQPGKGQRIAGWALTALVGLGLLASAGAKLSGAEDMMKNIDHLGFSAALMKSIGVLEILCVALYLVPRTMFLGAILLTGYLGGATCTHVRVGDPFVAPIVLGVLLWVAFGLRHPAVIKGSFGL
jgi:DoxX-like family